MLNKAVFFYLLIVNFAAAAAMRRDKRYAEQGLRRIPEKTLFLWAVLGGTAGGILGMHLFHHKTRHKRFTVGFPLLLILQISAAVLIVQRQ